MHAWKALSASCIPVEVLSLQKVVNMFEEVVIGWQEVGLM